MSLDGKKQGSKGERVRKREGERKQSRAKTIRDQRESAWHERGETASDSRAKRMRDRGRGHTGQRGEQRRCPISSKVSDIRSFSRFQWHSALSGALSRPPPLNCARPARPQSAKAQREGERAAGREEAAGWSPSPFFSSHAFSLFLSFSMLARSVHRSAVQQ